MTLGKKLNLGFAFPALILIVAGIWSYARFIEIGDDIDAMLEENDRSVQAAVSMVEALERHDSASLMSVAGWHDRADRIHHEADSSFEAAFEVAENNITLEGERDILAEIRSSYDAYRERLARSTPLDFDRYHESLVPIFKETMTAVDELRRDNHSFMINRASNIAHQAYRASLPGVVLVSLAVLFTLLFAWLIHVYVIGPLRAIRLSIQRWEERGLYHSASIETGDELEDISDSLDRLSHKYPDSRREL